MVNKKDSRKKQWAKQPRTKTRHIDKSSKNSGMNITPEQKLQLKIEAKKQALQNLEDQINKSEKDITQISEKQTTTREEKQKYENLRRQAIEDSSKSNSRARNIQIISIAFGAIAPIALPGIGAGISLIAAAMMVGSYYIDKRAEREYTKQEISFDKKLIDLGADIQEQNSAISLAQTRLNGLKSSESSIQQEIMELESQLKAIAPSYDKTTFMAHKKYGTARRRKTSSFSGAISEERKTQALNANKRGK